MKHNIYIKTLTPIHIGSGMELHNNIDFIIHNNYIHIIDYNKIPQYISRDQILSLHIYFEQGKSIKNLLPQNFEWEKISQRSIQLKDNILQEKTDFFEFIHDARFCPYIPGSSIKGAVNTALYLLCLTTPKSISIDRIAKETDNPLPPQEKYHDNNIILKKNIFHNFYRFSDAYFPKNTTRVEQIFAYTYNQEEDIWTNSSQYLGVFAEILPPGIHTQISIELPSEKSPFSGRISDKIKNEINKQEYKDIFPLTIHQLFRIINQFSQKLIEKEIEILESVNEPFSENYENQLVEILNKLKHLNQSQSPDTAILRIGKYTGFNNLTGHWHEELLDDNAFRIFNEEIFKNSYIFPKTRRITSSGQPFGFIQLSIQNP